MNNWKKENKIFLCDALGLEDGSQYKFFYGYLHFTIHIKEASTFFAKKSSGQTRPT